MKRKEPILTSMIPAGLLKGTLTGIGVTLAGAAVMSGLILREVLVETGIGYCAMGILLAASYAAAAVSMGCAKKKMAITAMLSGLTYYGILLAANRLCFKGGYEGVGVTGLVILAGAGSALLMALRPKKRRSSLGRKNRRR